MFRGTFSSRWTNLGQIGARLSKSLTVCSPQAGDFSERLQKISTGLSSDDASNVQCQTVALRSSLALEVSEASERVAGGRFVRTRNRNGPDWHMRRADSRPPSAPVSSSARRRPDLGSGSLLAVSSQASFISFPPSWALFSLLRSLSLVYHCSSGRAGRLNFLSFFTANICSAPR